MEQHLLKDIMTTDCITLSTDDHIYDAAVKMKQHDIGFIPVVEGKKLIGVVTDRDLVIRGYAGKHSGTTSIMEVISKDIESANSTTSIDEAAKLMASQQIRRLPVVDNGNLVGIIAIGDLAVRANYEDEAGEALSEISEHEHVH